MSKFWPNLMPNQGGRRPENHYFELLKNHTKFKKIDFQFLQLSIQSQAYLRYFEASRRHVTSNFLAKNS
jgi:hypothetical protein